MRLRIPTRPRSDPDRTLSAIRHLWENEESPGPEFFVAARAMKREGALHKRWRRHVSRALEMFFAFHRFHHDEEWIELERLVRNANSAAKTYHAHRIKSKEAIDALNACVDPADEIFADAEPEDRFETERVVNLTKLVPPPPTNPRKRNVRYSSFLM